MNHSRLLSLVPYLFPGTECWVFDDARTGLKEEAFSEGTSEMISRVVERRRIPAAARGFHPAPALYFSTAPRCTFQPAFTLGGSPPGSPLRHGLRPAP